MGGEKRDESFLSDSFLSGSPPDNEKFMFFTSFISVDEGRVGEA